MKKLVTVSAIWAMYLLMAAPVSAVGNPGKDNEQAPAIASAQTFTSKITYKADMLDDENTSRVIALEEGKRNLIRQISEVVMDHYQIEETGKSNSGQIDKKVIDVLLPYIVVFSITDNQWKNETLEIEVGATAEANEVIRQVSILMTNNSLMQHMINNRKTAYDAYEAVQRMKMQIAKSDDLKEAVISAGDASKMRQGYTYAVNRLKAADRFERGIFSGIALEYQSAIDLFTEAVTYNPAFAEAYFYRGIYVYSHKNDPESALSDFNRAIQLNGKDASFYESRGICYGRMEKPDSAINDFNRGLDLNPDSVELLMARGKFYTKTGDLSKALADYGRVIEMNSKHIAAYYSIGLIHKQQKDYARCIEDFDQVITLNDQFANAFYERAMAYAHMGNESDKPKVIADFQAAAKLGHTGAQDVLKSIKVEW